MLKKFSDKEPNDDWGLTPKEGPFNRSGNWSGVMGNVVNGCFDMSLSPWYWLYDRAELMSFTPVARTRYVNFEMSRNKNNI